MVNHIQMTKVAEQPYASMGSSLRKRLGTNYRCGVECVVRTVSDSTNPNRGRHFYGCRNYKNTLDKGCNFFRLVDDEVVDERDFKIEKLRRNNIGLRVELSNTKRWLKISVVFGLICLVFAWCWRPLSFAIVMEDVVNCI